MAKAKTFKFPRLTAGFYGITLEGEFVGYVMKEVESDSKETNWYVFDDNEQGKDIAMLHPENAIDAPDGLLREAKESAKNYFLNKPAKVEDVAAPAPIQEAEWAEDASDAMMDEPSDMDIEEDDNLFVSEDEDFEAFEDELLPLDDDLEFDSIEAEELVLA
jgi:hypothetical protein